MRASCGANCSPRPRRRRGNEKLYRLRDACADNILLTPILIGHGDQSGMRWHGYVTRVDKYIRYDPIFSGECTRRRGRSGSPRRCSAGYGNMTTTTPFLLCPDCLEISISALRARQVLHPSHSLPLRTIVNRSQRARSAVRRVKNAVHKVRRVFDGFKMRSGSSI